MKEYYIYPLKFECGNYVFAVPFAYWRTIPTSFEKIKSYNTLCGKRF